VENSLAINDRAAARINIILLSLTLAAMAISFFPGLRLWGFDSAKYYPVWLRIILALTAILLAIPKVARAIANWLSFHFSLMGSHGMAILYWFIAGAALVYFLIFRYHNYLLGDGILIRGMTARGDWVSYKEPLDYLLHRLIFALTPGGFAGADMAYLICSIAAFSAIVLYFAIHFKRPGDSIIALALMLSFSVIQFFCGYIENYTFAFIFSLFYFISASRDMDENRISPGTLLFLILAIASQILLVVLIPSLIYLLSVRYRGKAVWIIGAALFILTALAVNSYIHSHLNISFTLISVPFTPNAVQPYHFFSIAHCSDLLNIFLLNYPLLLLIPFIPKGKNSTITIFFIIALGFTFTFAIGFDPALGAIRDWDLMALASAPLLAYLIYSFRNWIGDNLQLLGVIILPLALFTTTHSAVWVALNSDKDFSYQSEKHILLDDIHYSPKYDFGYRNTVVSNIMRNMYNDIDGEIESCKLRLEGAPDDYSNVLQLIAAYVATDNLAAARDLVLQKYRLFFKDPASLTHMVDILVMENMLDDSERIYNEAVADGDADYRIWKSLGGIKQFRGQNDSAYYYYDLSFQYWPDAPSKDVLDFALQAAGKGYYDIAIARLSQIYSRIPSQAHPLVDKLKESLASKKKSAIDSLCNELSSKLAPRSGH
jgi:tetratricopeptide (TPR) repeat protein